MRGDGQIRAPVLRGRKAGRVSKLASGVEPRRSVVAALAPAWRVRSATRTSPASAAGASPSNVCPAAVSRDLPARASQQPCSERGLRLLDLMARGRLRDVRARGGSPEVHAFGIGNEGAKEARFEVDRWSLFIGSKEVLDRRMKLAYVRGRCTFREKLARPSRVRPYWDGRSRPLVVQREPRLPVTPFP